MATLELTLISASIPPHVPLDLEPEDTYAIIRCAQEQQRSKTTHDHGRTPVWNETFAFNLGDQDVPKFVFVQIFAARSDTDEFLGVARIPIFTTGETEGSLHVLVSPDKGETGKLKAVWRWKSMPKQSYSSSSPSFHDVKRDERDHSPVVYPPAASPYDEVTSGMAKLAVHKGQDREPYPLTAYGSATYPPPAYEREERSSFTSEPYPAPNDPSKSSYPPPNETSKTSYPPPSSPYPPTAEAYPPYSYSPTADAYPPYQDYQKFSSSSEGSYVSSEREGEKSPSSNTRGLGDSSNTRGFGDSKDKGHHSHHSPYGYAPPGAYGGGYPPPAGYPSPYGPPSGAYPSASGYPPAPAYPPAPYGAPPAPYGYPPSGNPYPYQPYPPYGYPPQAPYPAHSGHGSYAPGMYVGHSSHGKHGKLGKHYKHHKMPKHGMYGYGHAPAHYGYGHAPAHYGHYKHKKHKGFGKGYKFKKFKGFKKFKY